jgi:hypothetical protein
MAGTDHGVVGTDGVVPIYNPEARWCWWALSEIYTGAEGQNKYVPKVNDYVNDTTSYTAYRVDHLDPVTLIPTLTRVNPANMDLTFNETDVLFGVGPGTPAETYRVYLDRRTTPYTLSVDAMLYVRGSMCSYAKIFRGSDLSGQGQVVSKVYDSSGNFVSENVPLELVTIDSHTNYATKVVAACNCTDALVDGEICTVVFYSDIGIVVSKRQLMVENTGFIRSTDASKKYISHISLDCPFMSPTDDKQIDFPLNIPLNALNLMGTVHYSDGSTFTTAVDGTKFRVFGLDQFVSSIIGQNVNLVFAYSLAPNEVSYANNTVFNNMITEPYQLKVVNPQNSYTVKIFGYPKWINAATGYMMEWWLLNLERNVFFNVTPFVHFAENTGPYDPKLYGVLQRKSISLNLREVSGSFKPFIHTQLVDIVLNGPPSAGTTPWTISLESLATQPNYGAGIFAQIQNSTMVNLSSNFTSFDSWLENVYLHTFPLLEGLPNETPLDPTHFVVTFNGTSTEYPISDWQSNINISNTPIPVNSTIAVRFIRRTVTGDLQLAVAGMIVF